MSSLITIVGRISSRINCVFSTSIAAHNFLLDLATGPHLQVLSHDYYSEVEETGHLLIFSLNTSDACTVISDSSKIFENEFCISTNSLVVIAYNHPSDLVTGSHDQSN